jgi:type VI secretion system protein ImpE
MAEDTWPMVGAYREALRCEAFRSDVFAGRRKPMIFGDPPQWMAFLLESLRLAAKGQHEQAKVLRDQAFDAAPTRPGVIDAQAFDWVADADSRLGPVMEVIVNGRYYWAPFEQIRAIDISGVEDLRDLVWLPAHFTWVNGGEAYGLIPSRYPGSENVPDAALQLARKTEWQEPVAGYYQGIGQRTLTTDHNDYPLLDIRQIAIKGA